MNRQFLLRILTSLGLLFPCGNIAQADFETVEELAKKGKYKDMPWQSTEKYADRFIKLKGKTGKREPIYFTSPDPSYKLIYDSARVVADAERVVKNAFSNYRYKPFWDGIGAQKCKGVFAENRVLLVTGLLGSKSKRETLGGYTVPRPSGMYFVTIFPELAWIHLYKKRGAADFEKRLRTVIAHEFGHVIFEETHRQDFNYKDFSNWKHDYMYRLYRLTTESVAVYCELLHHIVESTHNHQNMKDNIALKDLLETVHVSTLYKAYLLLMIDADVDMNGNKTTWSYSFNRLA